MSALRFAGGAAFTAWTLAACMTNSPNTTSKAPPMAAQSANSACLTQTGSRLDSGTGCAAYGRSYSSQDIDRTGATTVGGALRLLDPSVTIQH